MAQNGTSQERKRETSQAGGESQYCTSLIFTRASVFKRCKETPRVPKTVHQFLLHLLWVTCSKAAGTASYTLMFLTDSVPGRFSISFISMDFLCLTCVFFLTFYFVSKHRWLQCCDSSGGQQRPQAYIHVDPSFPRLPFHPGHITQQSSLGCTEGPCWLSVTNQSLVYF